MIIEYHKHNISQEDISMAIIALQSTFISTGNTVKEFEDKFSKYTGIRHTVGLTSCTAALHLSLLALGIKSGDEVITTPMTFIATSNAILYTGATPVFVDVEPLTGNINADLIERVITPKTRAILPVHLYGHMCDMEKIRDIADRHGLFIIEDAAHALEAERREYRPGDLSDTACYSFYATKSITCGEGGALCTNNPTIAEDIRRLRMQGMTKSADDRYSKLYEHWDMSVLGWKYNMDNIKASLLINQIDHIRERWVRRLDICHYYEMMFYGDNIEYIRVLPYNKSARLMFTILVNPDKRDAILHGLQEKGVGVAVNYRAIHLLDYYRKRFGYKRGMFPIAESIGDRTISLPLYPQLTDNEVEYIVDSVKEVINE